MHLDKILTKEFLYENLINNRVKIMNLAVQTGCSKHSIIKYCKKHGIYEELKKCPSHKKRDLTNMKFNNLLVISEAKECNKTGIHWLCKCDCGHTKIIIGSSLVSGLTKTCGFCERVNFSGYKEISGSFFRKLKESAEKRNIEFNIHIEDIWEIYENQNKKCSLSGLKVFFKTNQDKQILQTASIDRIDSNIGYVKSNIQIIHKRLNLLKNRASDNEFLAWAKIIYLNNKEKCDSIEIDLFSKTWKDR